MTAIWSEPRPAGPPPVGRADWLLVAAFEVAALAEGSLRPDLAWRPLVTLLAVALPVRWFLLRRSKLRG